MVKATHLGEVFRDLQVAVRSISHPAVVPSAAMVRPVVEHMPTHKPKLSSGVPQLRMYSL